MMKNSTNLTKLSIAGFLLFSPVSIFAYPVSVLVVNPESSAIHLTAIGFALTFVTSLAYVSLMLLLKKIQRFTVLKFLLIITITGAIRGYVFYWVNDLLNLIQPSHLSERIVSSVLTTLIWLSSSNLIINISRNFKNEYQGALNQFLASQVAQATLDLKSEKELNELNQLQKDLSETLSELFKKGDNETFNKISERLTFHINDQLRPLSRRIWLRSLNEYPVINYKILLRDSIKLLNFPGYAFFLIMTGLAILNNLFLRSLTESILRTATYLAATWLVYKIYRMTFQSKQDTNINALFLIFIGTIPIFISEYCAAIFGFKTNFLAASLIIPIPIAVIIVLALFDLTTKDREFLMVLLEKNGDDYYYQTTKGVNLKDRQLASYLHNSFQSELLALSSQLAAAAISQDKGMTSEVLQRVSAIASRSLSEDLAKIHEEPLSRLDSVIDSWANLLDIRLNIPKSLLLEKLNSVTFVQTVEEIASNTFRHDKGTELEISAELGEIGVKLYFQSNGQEPLIKSKGMGKSWLNQISISPWTIVKNEVGTLVTLEI